MKFTAFSLTLYLIQGYVTSFQRAQLLLTGTGRGQRHRACACAHASITCVRDLEPKVFSPLWEITMACDQKAGARGWHTEGAPACLCCCPSCSLLALFPHPLMFEIPRRSGLV